MQIELTEKDRVKIRRYFDAPPDKEISVDDLFDLLRRRNFDARQMAYSFIGNLCLAAIARSKSSI